MFKNAGDFPSDVVPAKFLKCSRDRDTADKITIQGNEDRG